MKQAKTNLISGDEFWGIQINGSAHCKSISCKWQGLTACNGVNIIRTGSNSIGYKAGKYGIIENSKPKKSSLNHINKSLFLEVETCMIAS